MCSFAICSRITSTRASGWWVTERVTADVPVSPDTQSVLRRHVELTTLRREYLSDVALTTAGLGMIWEQQALQPKLGGILGRRKAG